MNKTIEERAKERCDKELYVIEHFGLPEDVSFNKSPKVIYADLVDMLAGYEQRIAGATENQPAEAGDGWTAVEDGLLNMNEEILIHVFKMVSLIDLSECSFEYDIDDDKNHWCNVWSNGIVVDAILFDGNLFHMMNNDGSFHPLNPMYKAYKALSELAAPPTVTK